MFRKPWFFISFIAFFAIIGLGIGHLVVKYIIPMSGANFITFRDIAGTYFFCAFLFGVIAYFIALLKV